MQGGESAAGPRHLIILRQEVDWRLLGDELIVRDSRGGRRLVVNRTGSALWPLLAKGADVKELAGALAASFALEHERAEEEVGRFVSELRRLDLVTEPG